MIFSQMAKFPEDKISFLLKDSSAYEDQPPLQIGEGGRNDFLCSMAGYMRMRGLNAEQIEGALSSFNKSVLIPPESKKRIQQVSRGSNNWEAGINQYIKVLSDIEEKPMDFVIKGYIPARCVTILEGDPAVGKSSLLGEISAAITTGKDFCGVETSRTGNILFFAIEDDPASVFKVRTRLQGADQTKVSFVPDPLTLDDKGLTILQDALIQKRYELVVIDTFTSTVGHLNMNDGAEMASLLRKLASIASNFDTSILVVRHLRKGGSDNPHYAGSGSVAITGAARSVLLVKLSPDNPSQRYLAQSKSNGAKRACTLVFSIDGVEGEEVGRLVWQGKSALTAEDVIALKMPPAGEFAKAEAFLREYLAAGPRKSKDVFAEAEKREIAERTLNRVKADIGIISSGGPNSKWQFPQK